jgi:hypothetical protein
MVIWTQCDYIFQCVGTIISEPDNMVSFDVSFPVGQFESFAAAKLASTFRPSNDELANAFIAFYN